MRSLEDTEQRLADARANSAADKSSKKVTPPQKEPEPDDKQKELVGQNAVEEQDLRNRARSLQIEEIGIDLQGDKTKSNITSISSESTTTKRGMLLELEALKI